MKWVKSRKLAILSQIEQGKETLESLWAKYEISPEEIAEWQRNLEKHGEGALRVTHIRRYRK